MSLESWFFISDPLTIFFQFVIISIKIDLELNAPLSASLQLE